MLFELPQDVLSHIYGYDDFKEKHYRRVLSEFEEVINEALEMELMGKTVPRSLTRSTVINTYCNGSIPSTRLVENAVYIADCKKGF